MTNTQCDLINKINKLTAKSTKKSISAIINYDLKQLSTNTKVSEEKNPIKSFLNYKATTTGYFEPDTTDTTIQVLKKLLAIQLDIDEKDISFDNKRVLSFVVNDKRIHLETDTMNSFWTTYKAAIINLLQDYNLSCKKAMINTKKPLQKQLNKLVDNYDEFDLKTNHSELDKQLNTFATLTHSVMNMCLVPRNFNRDRLAKTNDYWDLSLMLLKTQEFKEQDSNYIWYLNNLDKMILEDFYEDSEYNYVNLLFDNHGFTSEQMLPKTLDSISECVKNINNMITLRGLRIIKLLNPKCDVTCDEMIADILQGK